MDTSYTYSVPAWEKADPEFSQKMRSVQFSSSSSWTSMDGVPVQVGVGDELPSINELLASKDPISLNRLRFRDPDEFHSGGLHDHAPFWRTILIDHPQREMILHWIQEKVDVTEFLQPFKGLFKGVRYQSDAPPSKVFHNHSSCKAFAEFVTEAILKRVSSGAIRIWGEVDRVRPPWLLLPLTVEPSKPRLCIDARFLNLWMKDCPFTLDKLSDVPRYVYKDSYMTKCDDKSGYDHVLLQKDSQEYFGFEWSGWWFVCATLPFGWKESPYIYHSIGLAVSG